MAAPRKSTKKSAVKVTITPPAPATASAAPAPAPQSGPAPVLSQRALDAKERFRMIQEAAYYLAEKDGFRRDATAYWMEAEKQISELNH